MSDVPTLSSRREFLFLYDIKMGNPNGDPDENRPRVLPDGTHYVTDVRLKRFVRDYFKAQGREILVDTVEGKTTNLTGRVAAHLKANDLAKCEGEELVNILLDGFIDARLFGSSFAFKPMKFDEGDKKNWEPTAEPKTLTGAVQIQHGEVKNRAVEVDIHGTSTFGSDEGTVFGNEKGNTQGTFTTYFGLRYAMISFHGIANEHSAQLSRLTDDDYNALLDAMWKGVRSAGNTRTKLGQVPRLLISINYKRGVEFQFGNLSDYVTLEGKAGKDESEWASPDDFLLDIGKLETRLKQHSDKIAEISYCISPDVELTNPEAVNDWNNLAFDGVLQEVG